MNQPVFLKVIKAQNVFKISDRIKGYNAQQLPVKKICIKQYQCKKNLKNNVSKKSQDYSLWILQDQSYLFLQFNQFGSSKPSIYTLASKQFLEENFLSYLVNQSIEKSSKQYQISGFRWQGFLIQFLSFSEDLFFLIITNQMTSSIFKNITSKDLYLRMKQSFQQFLCRIVSQKQSPKKIQTYTEQIKLFIQKRKQLITQTSQGKVVNFNLIKYGRIVEQSQRDYKSKMEAQKKYYSPMKMQVQK